MTRQWLADPALMCVPHRNAEHAEAHMFMEKMSLGHSLQGYQDKSEFFGADYVVYRHNLLVDFMPNHSTPIGLPPQGGWPYSQKYPLIQPTYEDYSDSIITLMDRCDNCRRKMVERLGI